MPPSLTVDEVSRRLGVRRQTVYAYVSRGLLVRHGDSTRRRSLFDHDDVERLAARARRPERSDALDVVVDTELTLLDPDGRLSYRGRDAVQLARFSTFEGVAALLWDDPSPAAWTVDDATARVLRRVRDALPPSATMVDRIPVIVAAVGAAAPASRDRDPATTRRTAATILASILDGLPAGPPLADRSAAARLWSALAPDGRRPRPVQLAAVNAALVLMADHELAASTLAARVAASAWADPYRVVLAGLGPLGGTLHGGASRELELLLGASTGPADVAARLEARIATGEPVGGFGHRVYRDRDPRADELLRRIDTVATDPRAAETVAALLACASRHGLPAPNADVALAALTYALGLRVGAAATIFTVGRTVGLLAHGIEEHPHRLRFRPRASYVGVRPRG